MTTVPAAVALGLLPEGYVAGARQVVAADAQMVAASRQVSTGLAGVGNAGRAMAADIARSTVSAARSLAAVRFEVGKIHAAMLAFAAVAFLRKAVAEASEAQAVFAQLQAGVKSTGGAAGLTAQQLGQIASQLQKVTTYSDEAIGRAESLLLTFTNIKGDTFRDATAAVLDLATRMDGDLKGAAIQVGKALEGSKAGMTALTRSGVVFSEEQKKTIATLFATGQAAKAQAIILQELQVEFGGSAVAARDTLGGALSALKNRWDDLFESVGQSNVGAEIRDAVELAIRAIDLLIDEWPYLAAATDETLGHISERIGKAVQIWIKQFEIAARGLQLLIELTPASTVSRLFGGEALPSSDLVGEIANKLKAIGDAARETGDDLQAGFGIKADEALRRANVAAGLAATGYRKMGEEAEGAGTKATAAVGKMIRELERSLAAKKAELAATLLGDEAAQRSAERAAAVAKAVADAREKLANAKVEIDPKVADVIAGLAASLVDVGFAIDDAKARQDGLNATWKDSVEELRTLRASLREGVTLTAEEAAGIVASLETQVRTLSQSLRIAGEGTQAHGKLTRELAAAQGLLATALSRTVAIQAQAERAGRAAIESQSRALSDQIGKIRQQTIVLGLSSDAARRWHDEQDAMAEAARIASATIEHVAGESAGEYARRWLEAARAARAAIEDQADAEYAARIKAYVEAPLKQAAAQTRDSFLDAFAAWVSGAKISVKELIQSWLQLWIRAFAEWLARWIATQVKAAAAARAAKIAGGDSTGGGGVSLSTGGLGASGGTSAATANTLAGTAVAAYALYVVYLAFIRDTTVKFAEVKLNGGSAGNDAQAATKLGRLLSDLAKSAAKAAEDLQLGLTELANITLGVRAGKYYVKDPGAGLEQIGRGFDSIEEALEYAQVRAIQLGTVAESVGLLVQKALQNSRATTLEGLRSDIDFARLLQNAGLDASLAELQTKLQTFISNFSDNWKRAIDLFGSDLPALAQALAGVGGILVNAFRAERDLLTGKQRTQAEELQLAQARAKIWNATKAVQESQIALSIIELKARIALMQAIGGNGNTGSGGRPGQGAGQGGGTVGAVLGFASAMVQTAQVAATSAAVITASGNAQLDALRVQLAALEALQQALRDIPAIDLGDVVVPGGGNRGGGGGNSKADDKKWLADFFKQIALSKMRDVGRALAEINERYREARDRANGDAAAIARLNEERQREINLLKRDLARRTGEFFGRGGELGSSLRSVNDQVQDLINSYRDLHDAGELTTAELHRMVQALINAAQAQRQAIVQGAYSDLLLSLLDATGKTTEAAQERWRLSVLEYQIKLAELKFAIQQYNLIGFNVDRLQQLLDEYVAAGPPVTTGPPPPANDNIQDLYRQRLAEQAQQAAQLRDEATRLLRSYQTQALNPLQQALARLAEDFQKIRAAFGNTAEVQQAYNAALLRIIDDQLRPIQEYLDSVNFSEESPLDPQAQLEEAQRQYQAILAAVQGGDYSRIGELTAAAQRLLQAQGAVSPMATQQYRDLFAAINAQLLELQRRIREQAAAGILPGGSGVGSGAGNAGGRGIQPPGATGGTGGRAGGSGGPATSGDPIAAAIERGTALTLPYFVRIARGAEETASNTNRIARQLENVGGSALPS